MSKSTEQFNEFMDSDRGEREIYLAAGPDDVVFAPFTRDGFEALVEAACKFWGIDVTGPIRNISVGYLHSLPRTDCETSIKKVAYAIRSVMSNHVTYEIDQEIKTAAQAEAREEQEAARRAAEELKKQEAIAKRQAKFAKKDGKTLPVVSEGTPDETAN